MLARSVLVCVCSCWRTLAAATTGSAVGALSDTSALIQGQAGASRRQAAAIGSRYDLGAAEALGAARRLRRGVDCAARPALCEAPFRCGEKLPPSEVEKKMRTIADDGHANFHAWCRSPQYWDSLVQHCLIEKDLVKSAHVLYGIVRSGAHGEFNHEMDGSYCFIEGHCTNEAVTESTTVEEAEGMCDARFGHRAWAEDFGWRNLTTVNMSSEGFADPRDTRMFLKLACAMGNFHCDIVYCKETFCKTPYYINKYGHLLPEVPGHLIVQRG